ncbi:cell envelope integrity protein TolA [Pseudoxanthomonas spadix]|uniref:cell envelope integrity protein TolA n=1 Tax=Pseudoxanthomonas spadix TaxID=415229 RepID=UPI000F0026C4|nr:cell envelope integrity protein TolA [Pseudoxanthomonas spadix]MBP3974240.1 cell envelope integrity protein TolA [Pseudoxanthomonas spadix]RMW94704.1 cell envelope integrity protein TolA [Pseudoxanthomonas spadix]
MHAEASSFDRRDPRDRPGTAVVLAVSMHLLLLLLIVLSSYFNWNTDQASAAAGAPAIEASLEMSASDMRAAQQAIREASKVEPKPEPPTPTPQPVAEQDTVPPPQPLPEPRPQDSQVPQQQQAQEPVPDPDQVNQEEASRLAIAQEKAEREQEAKRRQEQIDLTERKRQEEAERKQRLAEQQLEDDRQKKLAAIRAQREQAARQARLAEQKLRQLADARAKQASAQAAAPSAPPGQNGVDEGLGARYKAAIQSVVTQQWTRPDSVSVGTRCVVEITQLPGGEVMEAQVRPGCPMDAAGQRSIEAAVLKAQPLPYRGFEPVFRRKLTFIFEAQDR